jgi:beta-alanine degradation protein BauB
MRNASKLFRLTTGALLTVAALFAPHASGQDPVKVAPESYKVLLENDRVRVLDVDLKPGASAPMHSHPAYILYPLTESRIKITHPNGKTEVIESKPGRAIWREPMAHAMENVGTTESHVLNIELKECPKVPAPAKAP